MMMDSVAGHSCGKKEINQLAGTAVISDGHAMDPADMLHELGGAGRVEDSLGDGDSNTMEKLRDGQVKLDVVRYEY
jgi:hypothetical protein